MLTSNEYYKLSIEHRNTHKCGGMPFENGDFLSNITREIDAKNVLEIGTAIGYSAFCFARTNIQVKVDTIDIHQEHLDLAVKNWTDYKVEDQITPILGKSSEVIIKLQNENKAYDIIFFDAFSPNPDEVITYIKLLSENALLITTNLELPSEINRVDEYLRLLDESDLETKVNEDVAFSSTNRQSLMLCKSLWY